MEDRHEKIEAGDNGEGKLDSLQGQFSALAAVSFTFAHKLRPRL